MGMTLDPVVYGKLLAAELPKPIEDDEEFERAVERLEALDFPVRELSQEQKALREILAALIDVYDRNVQFPDVAPHEMVQFLMDQRGLKQADLIPIFGSRSVASDVINGKREPSKAHIRKLAEFFHLSPAAFF